jgi:hypothetical protein
VHLILCAVTSPGLPVSGPQFRDRLSLHRRSQPLRAPELANPASYRDPETGVIESRSVFSALIQRDSASPVSVVSPTQFYTGISMPTAVFPLRYVVPATPPSPNSDALPPAMQIPTSCCRTIAAPCSPSSPAWHPQDGRIPVSSPLLKKCMRSSSSRPWKYRHRKSPLDVNQDSDRMDSIDRDSVREN